MKGKTDGCPIIKSKEININILRVSHFSFVEKNNDKWQETKKKKFVTKNSEFALHVLFKIVPERSNISIEALKP